MPLAMDDAIDSGQKASGTQVTLLKPAALAGLLASQLQIGAPKPTAPSVLVLQTYVAGTYYRGVEPMDFVYTHPFPQVRLEREPDNPYDTFAVRVYADETWIGYIPAERNQMLARMMDAGYRFSAQDLSIAEREDGGCGLDFTLAVYLEARP